jgi:hypothetical protein
MRWMLQGDWPVGPAVIPAGTILTGDVGPDGEPVVSPPLTAPLPINAVALDAEAALQMCMWYEETASIGGWHQLHFHPSVDREAVMAQARERRRWPNGPPAPCSSSISPRKKEALISERILRCPSQNRSPAASRPGSPRGSRSITRTIDARIHPPSP